jgi:DNA adenine methylase
MKPFVKWAGGKRQLLPTIKQYVPKKFNRYFEPFIGGGALFFNLGRTGSYISDINKELINTYQVVSNGKLIFELIDKLKVHKKANCSEYYYQIRDLDKNSDFQNLSEVDRAARFIYLNKTCFNGIQRENSKGHNNVPFGDNPNPNILDDMTLIECYRLLSKTEICHAGFETIVDKAQENDFVYFDPPYVPLPEKLSFTKYSQNDFSMEDHEKLKKTIDTLHNKGVYVMISNSYSDITEKLYADYKKIPVDATRMLNSKGNNRGAIKEMLVITYDEISRGEI